MSTTFETTHPSGPVALFTLMAGQHSVASIAQARQLGVSRAVERRLLREGALVDVMPGVLGAGGAHRNLLAAAMAATLRPGVVAVSHGTAARLHGLAGFESYEYIDVIGDRGAHLRFARPVVGHYSRGPIDGHIVHIGAVAVTSIALTIVLVASFAGRQATALALADAISRGVPAARVRAVATSWRATGRPGPAMVLQLLRSAGRIGQPTSSSAADQGSRVPAATASVTSLQRA